MMQKYGKIYQFSTITSLAAGNFDGVLDFDTLLKQGNFGLGTFDHLHGELVVLDGNAYQLKADGKVNLVNLEMTTPFASVAFFEVHKKIVISQQCNYEAVQKIILENLPSFNLFYGIKINGLFLDMKTRTVSWQEKPYPTLLKATAQQAVVEVKNVTGDIVGFWTPAFANTLGVDGFHSHFISTTKDTGGHVFDFILKTGVIEICYFSKIDLELPTTDDYLTKALMGKELQKEIELAEKAK
ncbi:acetolactate decarboxylase [Spiroplasma sp. SV19]|uniref:acetolactate decarboxylase n=1 Tax=Spiroplasma sp. SV19 TaxID=2570468 RepID=UPI0024B774EA|nr:acetolactate decarboxylase [Spiroplasma sp. SV19]WHQ37172.1 acetolactate decarboxylase [Spiroplasma sp. SV19]